MALEIEHKYLVKNNSYRESASTSYKILQGYLSKDPDRTVRVRIMGDKGFLTIKGKNSGASRLEFEYEISQEDARQMLALCEQPILEKTRFIVPFESHLWEVDEFGGHRRGLVTAEIELQSEDESYVKPSFVGEDVTGDPSYYNSNLS
ncbi:MAG: CYTH domain-containing protein [Muribaculaceae bacterium]|nr:CYTH domain-containing protein [Muribaculaceae bacterium]